MGYLHINNLYKDQRILAFKQVYAMEKVHGTSAHVSYNLGQLHFSPGGCNLDPFVALFNKEELEAKFKALGHEKVVVFGEAYGGKLFKMKETYGDKLQFIVFDIRIGDSWLDVPKMAQLAADLGFEVVPWELVSTDVEVLNSLRDRPSEVAVRRGCAADREREGVVLRPPFEVTLNNGERLIVKHKGAKFEERQNVPKVGTPEVQATLSGAQAVADEWVTEMRLAHVLDKLQPDGKVLEIKDTPAVMNAMLEDVYREAKGEIVESKEVAAAIKRAASKMFHTRLKSVLA